LPGRRVIIVVGSGRGVEVLGRMGLAVVFEEAVGPVETDLENIARIAAADIAAAVEDIVETEVGIEVVDVVDQLVKVVEML